MMKMSGSSGIHSPITVPTRRITAPVIVLCTTAETFCAADRATWGETTAHDDTGSWRPSKFNTQRGAAGELRACLDGAELDARGHERRNQVWVTYPLGVHVQGVLPGTPICTGEISARQQVEKDDVVKQAHRKSRLCDEVAPQAWTAKMRDT